MPSRVLLADGDNELFVDFGNDLAVEAFVSIVKNRQSITLLELLQDESNLVVRGPEGSFAHEMILPFVRRVRQEQPRSPSLMKPAAQRERHGAGSEWLYAKLYTGSSTADALLDGTVRELVGRYGGQLQQWFFIRYGDPDFHLRLRFRLADPGLRRDLHAELERRAAELLPGGQIWDLRFGTYRPELERYGGEEGLRLCEQIFHADSEAVLAMLPFLRGDAGAEIRWLAALGSVHQLTRSLFGPDEVARAECLERMKTGYAEEFRVGSAMRRKIGARWRDKKPLVDAVLGGRFDGRTPLGAALSVLDQRRRAMRRPLAGLRALAREGRLLVSLGSLGSSLCHMSVNRLIPAEARAHEAVLYDFLHRHRVSRRARRESLAEKRREAVPA